VPFISNCFSMTNKNLALTTNTSQLGYSCVAVFKALLLLFTSPIG
jgi:hypothetical protein